MALLFKQQQHLDLWFESLAISEEDLPEYYWSLLDEAERSKAQRFAREQDRWRYVISRGKLRKILSMYLQQSPREIVFGIQSHGKPFIFDEDIHGIKFNISHSGNYLAVGISYSYEIGVDIEIWSDNVDYEAVLGLCFAESERSFWQVLPKEQRTAFFYRLWTRKESFVKAVGLGLELNVAQVATAPNGPSRFLSLPYGFGKPEDWRLIDLELSSGLSGAVAVPSGFDPTIRYKRLEY